MPTEWERVIGELSHGRERADQLRLMLRQSTPLDAAAAATVFPAQGLVAEILESFTHSLSILCAAGHDSDEVSQLPPPLINSTARKSEDSGESCKTPAPAPKDRRGCYKRRRTSETLTKETPTLFEDGHAWRKYGQKTILNAQHPRNYFRCTHKFDQGCQATKQVQKIQDDPPLFRTTYLGRHTCKNLFKPSHHHMIMDAAAEDSPTMWSFARNMSSELIHSDDPKSCVLMIDSSAAVKQENKEFKSSSSSSSAPADGGDYFISELTKLDSTSAHELGAFSPAGSEHGDVISSDVYSCTASTHSMEMEMISMAVFDDFLEFRSLN